ncbi:hypothetical protein SAMN05518847_1197 [Paenibacillus sp. OV219]|nr:hypothetical protein SAMN05518847_1197 [Paenibacillus sp. OV219]
MVGKSEGPPDLGSPFCVPCAAIGGYEVGLPIVESTVQSGSL